MQPHYSHIEQDTLNNTNFRQVLYTGPHMQLVVMSLKPGEEIGAEVHPDTDQFFRVEQGRAKFIIDGQEIVCSQDQVVIVPAGANHNVINDSDVDLKLYTIYTPPEHAPGTIHATKAEADAAEHH